MLEKTTSLQPPKILSPREKAIQLFEKCNIKDRSACHGSPTWLYWEGEGQVAIIKQGGNCHASMLRLKQPLVLASGFTIVPETVELGERFWAWISGPESPWRNLFINGIDPIYNPDNGRRTGWILPTETVSKADFDLMKNFCMATRTIYEKAENIIAWDMGVKLGLNPSDAFVLCSCLKFINGHITVQGADYGGWHWPISYYNLCMKDFREGKPRFASGRNDSIWGDTRVNNITKLYDDVLCNNGNKIETKFSTTQVFDMGRIVELFSAWRDKNG